MLQFTKIAKQTSFSTMTYSLRSDASSYGPHLSAGDVNIRSHLGKGLVDPFTFSNDYWTWCVLPSITVPPNRRKDHCPTTVTPRYCVSPFGPHMSQGKNIWSCDGIDPFAFSNNEYSCCERIPNGSNCKDLSSQHSRFLFARQLSMKGNCNGVRSTAKEQLVNDGDDGWSDLEASLNHVTRHAQLQVDVPENAVLDSRGRRDITRDALYHELMRFSRVIRLETFMEIFKINSFPRLVEFLHCLMTFCSIQTDPRFGYMVIPKGHLYVPARKMTISPHTQLHPLGFTRSSPKQPVPSSPATSTRSKPEASKRLSPRSGVSKPTTRRSQRRGSSAKSNDEAIVATSNRTRGNSKGFVEQLSTVPPREPEALRSDLPWRRQHHTPHPHTRKFRRAAVSKSETTKD